MKHLDFDEWLYEPVDGWASRSEQLDCTISENGLNMELGFDYEAYYAEQYELYLTT